jgi:nicotinamide phosphoribosyltransferase
MLAEMRRNHLSADNIAFGMGAELLQKVNRDTLQFAMKASAACVAGEWRDVYKAPVTDQGKRSKRGRLALVDDAEQGLITVREEQVGEHEDLLVLVFRNGELLRDWRFNDIRRRASAEGGA